MKKQERQTRNDKTPEDVNLIACLDLYIWEAIHQLSQSYIQQIALLDLFIIGNLHPKYWILINLQLHIRMFCFTIRIIHLKDYRSA